MADLRRLEHRRAVGVDEVRRYPHVGCVQVKALEQGPTDGVRHSGHIVTVDVQHVEDVIHHRHRRQQRRRRYSVVDALLEPGE